MLPNLERAQAESIVLAQDLVTDQSARHGHVERVGHAVYRHLDAHVGGVESGRRHTGTFVTQDQRQRRPVNARPRVWLAVMRLLDRHDLATFASQMRKMSPTLARLRTSSSTTLIGARGRCLNRSGSGLRPTSSAVVSAGHCGEGGGGRSERMRLCQSMLRQAGILAITPMRW